MKSENTALTPAHITIRTHVNSALFDVLHKEYMLVCDHVILLLNCLHTLYQSNKPSHGTVVW